MAVKVKELRFSVKNRAGVLAEITKALKSAKVNILHLAAWTQSGKGCFQLVTSSPAGAKKALRGIGIKTGEVDALVINLRHRVGALERIAKKLAKAKVDIRYMVATSGAKRVAVFLNTKNNARAIRLI